MAFLLWWLEWCMIHLFKKPRVKLVEVYRNTLKRERSTLLHLGQPLMPTRHIDSWACSRVIDRGSLTALNCQHTLSQCLEWTISSTYLASFTNLHSPAATSCTSSCFPTTSRAGWCSSWGRVCSGRSFSNNGHWRVRRHGCWCSELQPTHLFAI